MCVVQFSRSPSHPTKRCPQRYKAAKHKNKFNKFITHSEPFLTFHRYCLPYYTREIINVLFFTLRSQKLSSVSVRSVKIT